MPITPQQIAERRETVTFPFAGDTCTITYLPGQLANVTPQQWQQWMSEAEATQDDAAMRAAFATLVCRFIVDWDVVESVNADGTPGPTVPLDAEHLATFDPMFLATILREAAKATAEGNASAARSSGASAATSQTKATPAGSPPSAVAASQTTSA